jgi:hypothetical protein
MNSFFRSAFQYDFFWRNLPKPLAETAARARRLLPNSCAQRSRSWLSASLDASKGKAGSGKA